MPDFVAKTQNPLVPDDRFLEFSIPSVDDFVGGDHEELLLYPIRALHKYLARMEQYHFDISGLFVSTSCRKKRVSQSAISFCLQSVNHHTYVSAFDEDCQALRVKAHEVRKVATSLLFGRNCATHQVLKAGT